MFHSGGRKVLTSLSLFTKALLALLIITPTLGQVARAQTVSPGVKSDRKVYAEPALPALPAAGGTYVDPVFGATIMRATDERDFRTPGCGTWYNQWPTFNSDRTKILIRCGGSGDMMIKTFDPTNFTVGPVILKTWGGGATQVNMIGGEYAQWQGAT